MGDDVVLIQRARCLRSTAKAVQVVSEDWSTPTWVPQAAVHDDSEVYLRAVHEEAAYAITNGNDDERD